MEKPKHGKAPQLRFAGFPEDWEDKPIGNVLTETKRSITLEDHKQYELITVKRRNGGVVSRGRLYGRQILVKNYSQLKAGDYLISKRQVVHGATGLVPPELDQAIVSNEYLVAVGNSEISTAFLGIISTLPEMYRKFFLSSYGVDIEKLFFDVEDWKTRSITIPKPSEQDAICTFFKELDRLIGLHQRKHEKLVTLKQAMLQKMFPQSSSTIPEIRFRGFSKPWNSVEMKKFGQPYSGLFGKTKADFGRGDGRFVTYMGVFGNAVSELSMTGSIGIDHSQNEVRKGDVLFTISSETPEEVGMSSVWLDDERNVYLNSFCFGFRPLPSLQSNFLAYVLRADAFRKRVCVLAQGISRYNISKSKVMEIPVHIPTVAEQRKIGTYFRQLDALIAQHATQLAKLKNLKAACLERMFV